MPSTITYGAGINEIGILARVFSDAQGELPTSLARYLLGIGFSDADKTRMRDLAARNRSGDLSLAEREELFAYEKAGTLLSILKSKARKVLRLKPKKPSRS